MSLASRFYSATTKTLYANGRSYSVSAGGIVDVPFPDALAIQSDQARYLMITGATADRPSNAAPGLAGLPLPVEMYDTTLGKPIFRVLNSNPTTWVDITGSAV
jgi:hypothetical protein